MANPEAQTEIRLHHRLAELCSAVEQLLEEQPADPFEAREIPQSSLLALQETVEWTVSAEELTALETLAWSQWNDISNEQRRSNDLGPTIRRVGQRIGYLLGEKITGKKPTDSPRSQVLDRRQKILSNLLIVLGRILKKESGADPKSNIELYSGD